MPVPYSPTTRMLEIAAQARARYAMYDRMHLKNLREELVKVAITPGLEVETYWLFQVNVQAVDELLLGCEHGSTAATGGDQSPHGQGS